MALINTITPPTALDRIKMLSTNLLMQMKQTAKQQFDLVWNNKDKTAQEVSDMLGVEACMAMDAHYNLQVLIMSLDNTWVPLVPPLPYLRNEDGTITVTYPEE
jgi:hypothetical protein